MANFSVYSRPPEVTSPPHYGVLAAIEEIDNLRREDDPLGVGICSL